MRHLPPRASDPYDRPVPGLSPRWQSWLLRAVCDRYVSSGGQPVKFSPLCTLRYGDLANHGGCKRGAVALEAKGLLREVAGLKPLSYVPTDAGLAAVGLDEPQAEPRARTRTRTRTQPPARRLTWDEDELFVSPPALLQNR